jgi:ribosomal protein L31
MTAFDKAWGVIMKNSMTPDRTDPFSFHCSTCGDEVIVPSEPVNGIVAGVCCTCRDPCYYDLDKERSISREGMSD